MCWYYSCHVPNTILPTLNEPAMVARSKSRDRGEEIVAQPAGWSRCWHHSSGQWRHAVDDDAICSTPCTGQNYRRDIGKRERVIAVTTVSAVGRRVYALYTFNADNITTVPAGWISR